MTPPEPRQDGPQLPPFDPGAKCPKCKHDVVSTTFSDGTDYECLFRGHCDHSFAHTTHEHLHRCCQRCHFHWSEAVSDA